MMTTVALFAILLALDIYPDVCNGIGEIVKTKMYKVKGRQELVNGRTIRVFLGLPYAEPPIGNLRFKPPVAKKHEKCRDAFDLPPDCYQSRDDKRMMFNPKVNVSEDCLYLNIWAPDTTKSDAPLLPVMVWIHGGGFYSGGSSLDLYDGKMLAAVGNVVVVTINYRLGPFGFLYLDSDDAPGNMGLWDQQMALDWIAENIDYFHGNKLNITVFGSEAGAASIHAQLQSTQYYSTKTKKPLFSRAILQSGSIENDWAVVETDTAKRSSEKIVEDVGCLKENITETMNCLWENATAENLTTAFMNLDGMKKMRFMDFPLGIIRPNATETTVMTPFFPFIKSKRNLAPRSGVIIGFNRDEGNIFLADKMANKKLTQADVRATLSDVFPKITDASVLASAENVYELSQAQCTAKKSCTAEFIAEKVKQMVDDYYFTCDMVQYVNKLKAPTVVYTYQFDQKSVRTTATGLTHGDEIDYIFGVPMQSFAPEKKKGDGEAKKTETASEAKKFSEEERKFSEKMMQYWGNFAKKGIARLGTTVWSSESNVTTTAAPLVLGEIWPEYNETDSEPTWLSLSAKEITNQMGIRVKECKFWNDIKYPLPPPTTTSTATITAATVTLEAVKALSSSTSTFGATSTSSSSAKLKKG